MAPLQPFCNLTNFYFSISPTEYYNNLLDEEWGCFKYVGMSWDMIMRLPIQERRAMVRKHNLDSERIEREYEKDTGEGASHHLEGEAINEFAKRNQCDPIGRLI